MMFVSSLNFSLSAGIVDSSCVGQSNYGEKYYSENGLLMLENLPEILYECIAQNMIHESYSL